jgi:hypothetical protein
VQRAAEWRAVEKRIAAKNSSHSPFVAEPELPWPTIAEAAYHGLAGKVVKTIEPHSESDPVAILLQFLACAGNIIGQSHWYQIEGSRHYPNLFVTLVGNSSKARKGTSYARVISVARIADECWASDRTKGGLSSGEGLINEVRDPVREWRAQEQEWELKDPGASDKRLLVVEPEFASALAVMERHGNILSPLIRKAWDGDKLATMTRNSPLTATGAHISIIGHITEAELMSRLTSTNAANGFANRFLFALVKRSKELPFGGNLPDSEIQYLGTRLREAITHLPAYNQIGMTAVARTAWAKVYGDLSTDRFGLLGAITARAEAQVIRLALIYTLLDGCAEIDVAHLHAGLAVWEYAEASAARIFRGLVGNPIADQLLRAINDAGPDGLSKTEAHALFGRNKPKEAIDTALDILKRRGLVADDTRGGKTVPVLVTSLRITNSTNNGRSNS